MPEPVLWTIQTSLKTAVETIDGTGSFFNTAATVAHKTNAVQSFTRDTFMIGLNSVTRETEETQGKYYFRAIFDIEAIVAPVTGVEDDQLRARLWSDIAAAVMADPQRTVSATRYAIDTQVLAPEIQDQYDERVGITAPVEVYFRQSITDPTSL